MKHIFLVVIFIVAMSCVYLYSATDIIDLNRATLTQLKSLPISPAQAQAIYEYRTYTAFFENIYDLRKIPLIDQATMLRLRPLVSISLFTDLDDVEQRREEIYYLIERLGSTEGIQEGFTDIWEDYLMAPRNINRMHYSDILNMPNVSPIDAAAIRRRTVVGDHISDYRNLRSTVGLSNFGATNLRHYIYYQPAPQTDTFTQSPQRLFLNYQFRYEFLGFDDDTRDMYREIVKNRDDSIRDSRHSYWGYFNLDSPEPAFTHKVRARFDDTYKAGFIMFNKTGEDITSTPEKYYAGYEGTFNLWGRNDIKIFAGNYRVTYGEGLVIENTDYFSSRKTGYGFSKRIIGITEDLSRSRQYALKGMAFELKRPFFTTAMWYSHDKKDAVVFNLNKDGMIDENDKAPSGKYHVFSYITPSIRFDNDRMNDAESFFSQSLLQPMNMAVRTNILEETMVGGRVEVSPFVGTHLGLTATQILYPNAHFVVPHSDSLHQIIIRDAADYGKWKRIDSQITNMYSTYIPGVYERDYRTVIGFDWRTVIGNTSFQGEYAELSVHGSDLKFGDDPSAVVMSTYTQFNNLHFIALYRNYDLAFDNPYNRGFSQHRKFNDTILNTNMYTLTNQLLGDMYLNSPVPQAEQGFYFETRYRFNRFLTLNRTYIDVYERKADGRRTVRFQGDIDYRPIYQLSLRGKYKHQVNRYQDQADRGVSETVEPAAIVTLFLSNRDRVQVEYRYTQVKLPPYTYLTNAGLPTNPTTLAQAQTLMHGDFIRLDWTTNLSDKLRFRTALAYWNGHSISHWDWEDIEIDFLGEHGIKYWVLLQNKIANNVYLSLKYKVKHYRTKELSFRTWWNTELEDRPAYVRNVDRVDNAVRMQIEWRY